MEEGRCKMKDERGKFKGSEKGKFCYFQINYYLCTQKQ